MNDCTLHSDVYTSACDMILQIILPRVRQHYLFAGSGRRRTLALFHGHQIADVGQHGLQVGHCVRLGVDRARFGHEEICCPRGERTLRATTG